MREFSTTKPSLQQILKEIGGVGGGETHDKRPIKKTPNSKGNGNEKSQINNLSLHLKYTYQQLT